MTLFAIRVIWIGVRLKRYFGWLLRYPQMISIFIFDEWIVLTGNHLLMCIIAVLSITGKWSVLFSRAKVELNGFEMVLSI